MQILNPAALPLFSVLGILILIYLRERWRKRIEVPSLMFWREVKEDSVRMRRFFPSLLFLAQALLLLLLLSGLLHPSRPRQVTETRGDRRILVFDISASMQAREGQTQRMALALDQASQVVRGLGPLDEAMLISVASRPRLVSGFTTDHRLLLHLLETLKPVDTETNLDLGIELALAQRDRAGRQATIHVFTDLPKNALSLPPQQMADLVYHRVGRNDDNLAVAALQVHQNPFQNYAQAQAYILVRNYAYRSKRATLTVRLNEQSIFRRNFTLPARETTSFSIKGFDGPGKLSARLTTDDALEVDNEARAWLAERRQRRLVLVSSARNLHRELEQVSRAIQSLSLTILTPETFLSSQLRDQDVVLFHEFVPSAEISANSMYVFPPSDNPLFPVVADATDVSILDWREGHEILRNLHYVEALPLKKARVLALPSWAQVLISSRTQSGEVPLALTGEKDGHRVVCLAFDLDKGNLTDSDNLTLLFLFLNAVRWLLPPDPTTPVMVHTGETFFFPPQATSATLRLIPHKGEEQQAETGETGAIDINQVGEYDLTGSQYRAVLYANLFNEAESDIGRREDEESAPVRTAEPTAPQQFHRTIQIEFGHILYAVAAFLLLGEWLYALWCYSRTRVV